jgi:hypothetical protein
MYPEIAESKAPLSFGEEPGVRLNRLFNKIPNNNKS